jgi:ADP-ribose pyrophosphatase YjhB (NUDIX family)
MPEKQERNPMSRTPHKAQGARVDGSPQKMLWATRPGNILLSGDLYIPTAAVIVTRGDAEILIVGNDYEEGALLTWNLPGGVVECGEDVCGAAVRELYEETGLEALQVGSLAWVMQLYREPEAPNLLGFVFEIPAWRGDLTLDYEVEYGHVRRAEFVSHAEACKRLLPAAATALRNWLTDTSSTPPMYWVTSVGGIPKASRMGTSTH